MKFDDYQSHGVEEYWIISPETKVVEQYHLEKGFYQLIKKSNNGDIESFAVKGFKIPIKALFDAKANLKTAADLMK